MPRSKRPSPGARVAALLDAKLPGARGRVERTRRPRKWVPPALVDLRAHVGPGTLLGPWHCRLLSVDDGALAKDLFTSVDAPGEWFGASWYPFLQDASGAVTCVDVATRGARVVYYDVKSGNGPQIVAPSLSGYLRIVASVLSKLPDPPDPEEDDFIVDEGEDAFESALRTVLVEPQMRSAEAPR